MGLRTGRSSEGRPASRRGGLRRFARRIVVLGLSAYLGVLLLLAFFETQLVYPAPRFPEGDWNASQWDAEDLSFESEDGTGLHGWLFPHPEPRAYLMFLHGNGENVGYLGPELDELRRTFDVSIFTFDYRGYGKSAGRPHEAGILADARAARHLFAQRVGVAPSDLVLMGRSLGGGVAVELARDGARGLILERTFTCLPDVAGRLFPWLPVRLLMRNRYDSLQKICEYEGPLLQCHGTADRVVPFEIGRKLYDAATCQQKEFVVIPGGGHNDPREPKVEQALARFLERLESR